MVKKKLKIYILIDTTPFFDEPKVLIGNLRLCGFAIAGFCVGFGTKLGNGCTSG